MEGIFTEYIFSTWGIVTNLIILCFFGLTSYNIYAHRWSAKSGQYFTNGHITWSEVIGGRKNALVSYSYTVDGTLYNGELSIPPFRAKKTVQKNPKGKKVIVYYAKKDPAFSQAYKPPNHFHIIGSSIMPYLLLPLFFVNMASYYIYWLIIINQ